MGKKQSSVIAKTRQLELTYIPKSRTPHERAGRENEPAQSIHSTTAEGTEDLATNDNEVSDEPIDWPEELRAMEFEWQLFALESFWRYKYDKFQRHLKKQQQAVSNDELFDETEKEAKREQMLSRLEHRFLERMIKSLETNLWYRLFRRRTEDIESLEKQFQAQNRIQDYKLAFERFLTESRQILTTPASRLFGMSDRIERLLPISHALYSQFRTRQKTLIEQIARYREIVESLPADELDMQIAELEHSYLTVFRSREWYTEFEQLITDVAGINRIPPGENESRIRVLQNDFVVNMQHKLPVYQKYYELRRYCFDQGLTDAIRDISFFTTNLTAQEDSGDQSYFSYFEAFTARLEEAVLEAMSHPVRPTQVSSDEQAPSR